MQVEYNHVQKIVVEWSALLRVGGIRCSDIGQKPVILTEVFTVLLSPSKKLAKSTQK